MNKIRHANMDLYNNLMSQGNTGGTYSYESLHIRPTMFAPKPRFRHAAFAWQGQFYLLGGTTIPAQDIKESPNMLYCFTFGSRKWQDIKTKGGPKDWEPINGQSSVLVGSNFYCFGWGSGDSKNLGLLWRLKLQQMQWSKMEQKGEVPSARESAFLQAYSNERLILYGGVCGVKAQVYNQLCLYYLKDHTWHTCDGNYIHLINPRVNPSLCVLEESIYIFGGSYRDRQDSEQFLNDMYHIKIILHDSNRGPQAQAKRIISPIMPQPRSGHGLVIANKQSLVLFGGQTYPEQSKHKEDVQLVNNSWVYHTECEIWQKLNCKHVNFSILTPYVSVKENMYYTYGGLRSYSQVSNELNEIKINLQPAPSVSQRCTLCRNKKLVEEQPAWMPAEVVEDIAGSIAFPFAAVGMLVDIGVANHATQVNVRYFSLPRGIKVLLVQDDAQLPWQGDELTNIMRGYWAGFVYYPPADKKIKQTIAKNHLKYQLGFNTKMGALRLGKSFVYFVRNNLTIRVFLCEKQGEPQTYKMRSFTFGMRTLEEEMLSADLQRLCPMARHFLKSTKVRNALFIMEPRVQEGMAGEQEQLKVLSNRNDILHGSLADITNLQSAGYSIYECVDVSLKAYLSSLYIRNQTCKIGVGVKDYQSVHVPAQIQLQKLDRLVKQKHILQLTTLVEGQLKTIQLYYLYDLRARLNFFSNGLLIFHRNRLITRFKYPLGQFLCRNFHKVEGNYNLVRLFGYLELPDYIPINAFKTGCPYPATLEKLYAQMHSLSNKCKKELSRLPLTPPLRPQKKEKSDAKKTQQAKQKPQ